MKILEGHENEQKAKLSEKHQNTFSTSDKVQSRRLKHVKCLRHGQGTTALAVDESTM